MPIPAENVSLGELLARHQRQLLAFILSLVHRLSDAEDVFQEMSVVLVEKFDQFTPGTDFVAWASKIAAYKALEHLRAKRRDRLCLSEAIVLQLAERQCEHGESLDARGRALDRCREKLSPRDRRTLSLCYSGELKIKEAAEQLGRPVGSVYNDVSRIRRALWNCIRKQLALEGLA